jgi:hypothetical protein
MQAISTPNTFFIFILLVLAASGNAQSRHPDRQQRVSFADAEKAILMVFPEACKEFIAVTFSRGGSGLIYPEEATFLIPDSYFKSKTIDQPELDRRAELLMNELGFTGGGCEFITFGEPVEYSWHAWKEKTVRKITMNFMIGC